MCRSARARGSEARACSEKRYRSEQWWARHAPRPRGQAAWRPPHQSIELTIMPSCVCVWLGAARGGVAALHRAGANALCVDIGVRSHIYSIRCINRVTLTSYALALCLPTQNPALSNHDRPVTSRSQSKSTNCVHPYAVCRLSNGSDPQIKNGARKKRHAKTRPAAATRHRRLVLPSR